MAKLLKLRRGTTSQHSSFTGAEGEVTVDTDKETLVVHDGSTAGGTPLAKESDVTGKANLSGATFTGDVTFDGATAGRDVVFDKSRDALAFKDNAYAEFGDSQDLQIYHNGSHSYIKETGTGSLIIQSNQFLTYNAAGDELTIAANENGNVELYYNGVKTFETLENGAKILGSEGNYAYLHMWEDEGDDNADKWRMEVAGGSFKLANYSTGSWVNGLTLDGSNNAVFYGNITLDNSYPSISWTDSNHNSDYRITNNDGTLVVYDVTNSLHILDFQPDGDIKLPVDNKKLIFGASDDLKLSSNGSKGIMEGSLSQVATAVSALELDLITYNYFTKTISANSTFTFANPAPSGTATAFTLELTHTSGTVTWPASVKWNGDTAPTLATGKTHLFMFVTDDAGSRYRGSALVDYVN